MTTLKALACLVAIVDEGSVTRAAAKLGISQPALSHQIAAIERELGTAVVERLARGVRPTAAGLATARIARATLASAEEAIAAGRAAGSGSEGTLRIACTETISGWLLPPVLRRWNRERPGVEIGISEYRSADRMIAELEAGNADLVVCPRPSFSRANVEVLGQEELLVVAGNEYPFDSEKLKPSDLKDRPFIHYERENGLSAWVDQFAAQHRLVLNVAFRTHSPRTAAQLAAAGMGVAIVPSSAMLPRPDGAIHSFAPPVLRDIVMVSMSTQDPLVRAFLADLHRDSGPDRTPGWRADQAA